MHTRDVQVLSVGNRYFEQRLDDTVTRTEKIPHDLALHGEVRTAQTRIAHRSRMRHIFRAAALSE